VNIQGLAIAHSLNPSFEHRSFSLFSKERSLFRSLNRFFQKSDLAIAFSTRRAIAQSLSFEKSEKAKMSEKNANE